MLAVPLRMVQVAPHTAICATRIITIMSTNAYQARRCLKQEKDAGRLINACGRDAAKSVIFMDNGAVVSSPVTVQTLMRRMALLDDEAAERNANASRFIKTYEYEKVSNPLDFVPPPPEFDEGEMEDDEDEDEADFPEENEDETL